MELCCQCKSVISSCIEPKSIIGFEDLELCSEFKSIESDCQNNNSNYPGGYVDIGDYVDSPDHQTTSKGQGSSKETHVPL